MTAGRTGLSRPRGNLIATRRFLPALPARTAALALALASWGLSGPASEEAMRLNNLGISQLEQYQFERGAELFARARALDPEFLPAAVNLGIARFYDRQYEEAEKALLQALEKDPRQVNALYVLALLKRSHGQDEEALGLMEKVLVLAPGDAPALYFAASLHSALQHWEPSIRYFRRALERDPMNVSAYYALAKTLIQKGDTAEAEKVMARFQEWKSRGTGTNFGNQYGEQGRYAHALRVSSPGEPMDSGGLHPKPLFADVSGSSGLRFVHAGPRKGVFPPGPGARTESFDAATVAFQGSGAAFLDIDQDGLPDLLLANASADGVVSPALYRNLGKGSFAPVAGSGISYRGQGMGIAAGDYDSDGRHDVFLAGRNGSALYHGEGNGRFSEVTNLLSTRLAEVWAIGAAFVDLDHDGDSDLFVACANAPNLVYRNDGIGSFTEIGESARLATGRSTQTASILDYNDSRDIDFLLLGGPLRLMANQRDASFADVTDKAGLGQAAGGAGMATGDFDGDGYVDICIPAREQLRLFWNEEGERFRAETVKTAAAKRLWNAYALDYDNDGDLDLLLAGEALALLENKGRRTFHDASVETGLDRIAASNARSILAADWDRDGDLDALVTRCGFPPLLLRNEGGNRHHALRLTLEGKSDNRLGTGAKVQWAAAGLWQHRELSGGLGFMSQSALEELLGLGRFPNADFVRVFWPTGVLQSETPPAGTRELSLAELDRKGTSCPLLYAWDGGGYRFVSDFLGGSATGYLTAPGKYSVPDTDEYVKIPAAALQPRDGLLSLKMANQLEEVIFFDMVRLLAVDHPAGMEAYPDERLQASPPFPAFRIHMAPSPRPVARALDGNGTDCTTVLREEDRDYVRGFRLLPYKGYAEEHTLELDLGDLRQAARALLIMDGWIDYATSSSNFAASQAGLGLVPPSLQVFDRGTWRTILPDMGFPAGLPKAMTVDLTGKVPRSEQVRLRIVTNMRIYWDRIRLETGPDPQAPIVATLPARTASVSWVGYPREWSRDGRPPFGYDYDSRDAVAPWKTHHGSYTPFGDVRDLLTGVDDRYVALAHGEAITAEFEAGALPPLPEGWVRDWLLYVDGFGKDMDRHSQHPDRLDPLPRHRDLPYRLPHWQLPTETAWREFRDRFLVREAW